MDLKKLRATGSMVVAGAVLAIIGTFGPWYGLRLDISSLQVHLSASVNGWHFAYLGWLVAILCAAAAVVALLRAVPSATPSLPLSEPLLIMGAGGLSALFVLGRIVVRPVGLDLRWGIMVALVGALIVAAGGFFENRSAA
jgi:hypothetical protein